MGPASACLSQAPHRKRPDEQGHGIRVTRQEPGEATDEGVGGAHQAGASLCSAEQRVINRVYWLEHDEHGLLVQGWLHTEHSVQSSGRYPP